MFLELQCYLEGFFLCDRVVDNVNSRFTKNQVNMACESRTDQPNMLFLLHAASRCHVK